MNCPTWNRSSSGHCCRDRCGAESGWTTRQSSTGSCGSFRLGWPGETYPSGTGRRPRCTLVSAGGPRTVRSLGCCRPHRRGRMRPTTSTGWCRSTAPSCAPTSTPAGAREGGRRTLGRSRGGLTSKIHLACEDAAICSPLRPCRAGPTAGSRRRTIVPSRAAQGGGSSKAPAPTRSVSSGRSMMLWCTTCLHSVSPPMTRRASRPEGHSGCTGSRRCPDRAASTKTLLARPGRRARAAAGDVSHGIVAQGDGVHQVRR